MFSKAWGLIAGVCFLMSLPARADECVGILSFINPVSPSVLDHTVERRGFVSVPFDYDHPEASPPLQIFYRFLPTEGGSVDDTSKPIAVVVNGGPGYSADHIRDLNHDYSVSDKTSMLSELSKTHRVLLMDQRGAPGQSAPLNLNDPRLNPYWVAANFNAHQVARDLGAVIDQAIPDGEKFYMIAQSYGGVVASVYVVEAAKENSTLRRPAGLLFASAALPYGDFVGREVERRLMQKKLNEKLLAAVPGINATIWNLRRKVQKIDQKSSFVDGLYRHFFDALKPGWEQKFARVIEGKLQLPHSKLLEEVKMEKGEIGVLNYILYSAMLIPGTTDRNICRDLMKKIVFDDWMIDECRHYVNTEPKILSQKLMVDQLDREPPASVQFPSKEEFKAALEKMKTAFFIAMDDGAVPAMNLREVVKEAAPADTDFVIFESGGHSVTFSEQGHEMINYFGFK